MEYLYIDESGSMTTKYIKRNPYFVISIVRAIDLKSLRKSYTRFVQKYLDELKESDTEGKMFKDGKFCELKGSIFNPNLKRAFVNFLCRCQNFELFFIVVDNSRINGPLFDNTARAFNYLIKLALDYFIKHNLLPDEQYIIQLDERNEKTESKRFLQDYLNAELVMNQVLSTDVDVKYFDSANNKLIQVADVFSNIYFSNLITSNYRDEISRLVEDGFIKSIFKFPL
jgi:hypothetical protein